MGINRFATSSVEYFKGYLKEAPGVPQERLDVSRLPSLVNGKLIAPTGIKANSPSDPRKFVETDLSESYPTED